jgi:hypothetical protein
LMAAGKARQRQIAATEFVLMDEAPIFLMRHVVWAKTAVGRLHEPK